MHAPGAGAPSSSAEQLAGTRVHGPAHEVFSRSHAVVAVAGDYPDVTNDVCNDAEDRRRLHSV
jgi:hypothetical protein